MAVAHAKSADAFRHGRRRGPRRVRGRLAARRAGGRRAPRRAEAASRARPRRRRDALCELVCSNSMRGAALANAVGLLKEELRRAGSLVMRCADATRVPAGGALAVDRERVLGAGSRRACATHPRVTHRARVVDGDPGGVAASPVILATGPLTGDALAADLARGRRAATHLAYYDAIAPIVERRLHRLEPGVQAVALRQGRPRTARDEAYVNCPLRRGAVPAPSSAGRSWRAARRCEPRELRGRALLRGLPAHRGDGRRAAR